jgi:hypothetical protein
MYHQSPSYESIDDAQISEHRQYNKICIGDNDYPSVGKEGCLSCHVPSVSHAFVICELLLSDVVLDISVFVCRL